MTPREVRPFGLDPVETVCKPPVGRPIGVKTQSDLVSNGEKPREILARRAQLGQYSIRMGRGSNSV